MGETISNHAHKTGSWYLLGDLIGIKIFEEQSRPSYICVLLPSAAFKIRRLFECDVYCKPGNNNCEFIVHLNVPFN